MGAANRGGELCACGAQTRVGGTFGDAQDAGDFGHGSVVEIVKNEDRSLVDIERLQRLVHLTLGIVVL
jgi:hypothetical protein